MKEYAPWTILAATLAFSLSAGEMGEPAPTPDKPKAPDTAPVPKAPDAPKAPAADAPKDPKAAPAPAAGATPAPKGPEAPVQADVQPTPPVQPEPPAPADIKPRTDTVVAMRLLDDLTSADPAVAEASLKGIIKPLEAPAQKDEASFKYFVKVVKDYESADKDIHEKAAKRLLSTVKDVRASAQQVQIEPRLLTLVENVAGPKPQEQEMSAAILNNAFNETLKGSEIKAVIDDLASPEAAVVAAANKKLLEYAADAVDLLIAALSDERAPVKDGAADMLKTMGSEMIKGSASDIAYYLDNDDKHTRRLAAKLLEGLGADASGAMDDLVNYLDNDDKSVRRVAANILKKIGPEMKEKTDDLVQLLSNDDKNTRSLATELLISLGANAKEATSDLAGLVDDTAANDADVRQRCAKVLAAIGPDAKESLETLKKHSGDPDTTVKAMVELAIKKIEGGAGEVKEEVKEDVKEEKDPAPDDKGVKDEKKDDKKAVKADEKKDVKPDEKKEEKVEVKKDVKPEEKKEEKKQ